MLLLMVEPSTDERAMQVDSSSKVSFDFAALSFLFEEVPQSFVAVAEAYGAATTATTLQTLLFT